MSRIGGYAAREPGSLKEAQQALIEAVGGLDRAAEIARVGRSQLARYSSAAEEHETTNMPADVVDCLEAECGQAFVTAWLAHRRHALLVPLPGGAHEPFLKQLCEIGRKTGTFFAEAYGALADGRMTAKEAGRVKRESMRLATALAVLLCRLDAVIKSGKAER